MSQKELSRLEVMQLIKEKTKKAKLRSNIALNIFMTS